jgi:dTDP-4-amino-4,6-dideoxygalactose transaminase
MGHVGCTSFFPSKNLGCFGDGGAMFTNDDNLANVLRSVANHGMEVRYHHDRVGVNSRLDGIQAAVLDVKLRYHGDYTRARQRAAEFYDSAFRDVEQIKCPVRSADSAHVFHQYTIQTERRDELKAFLAERGIPSMVYYPIPLHLQKAFAGSGFKAGDCPVSERLAKRVLSLPMHTELDEEQLEFIVSNVKNFFA